MKEDNLKEDAPPVFGSWKGWYVFILLVLVIQMVLYSWLTYTYL